MFECALISHGNLAEEFLNTVHMIAGDVGKVETFGLDQSESVDNFQKTLEEYFGNVERDVIVFCDMLGGSPMLTLSNIVSNMPLKIGLITGMNLGMVIEVLLLREQLEFHDAIKIAERTGVEGIRIIVKEDLNGSSTS